MKAGLISLGSTSSQWTIEAMKDYFDEVVDLNLKKLEVSISGRNAQILYNGDPLGEYDCIYAKGSFRYKNILRTITTIKHKDCFMPINTESFTVAHDKLLTQLMLQSHDIPMPTTYISSGIESARNLLKKVNYPVVMKFPEGTQGKGVMFADSYSSASSILDAMNALKQGFIIQEYIETQNSDIRAFVIGDEVVASMIRIGRSDEKRANLHAGGTGEEYPLSPETKKIAVKAAKATGADICGVDLLEGPKGPLVIESNISPGLQGITKHTDTDVADKIAEYLHDKSKERLKEEDKKNSKEIMADVNNKGSLITNVDIRANRIFLPKLATKISGIKESDQVELTMKEGNINLNKLDL